MKGMQVSIAFSAEQARMAHMWFWSPCVLFIQREMLHVKSFRRFELDEWCTEGMDIALFLWDFLTLPVSMHIYILNKKQTAARPALSGNNICYSGKHFLRSEKEIPPSIKYVGKRMHS